MKRLVLAVGAVLGVVAVATVATIVAAGWTDTQTASGNVSVSLVPDLLYICEPSGPNPDPCPGDDSGADEIIFETDEQMLPNDNEANFKEWRVRLRNIDPVEQWDIAGHGVSFTETGDPGNDCSSQPSWDIWTVTRDDDHYYGVQSAPERAKALDDAGWNRIHVGPLAWDDMRLRTWIPGSFPVECQANAWDMNIQWTAEVH